MIVGNGAGFDYLVNVLVNLDLNVIKFLCRFQYGLYVIIFTRYCLLKFMLLDLFYCEKLTYYVASLVDISLLVLIIFTIVKTMSLRKPSFFSIVCTESIRMYVCTVYHQLLQYIAKLR